MLEVAQAVQVYLHKHDRPLVSLHEEMVRRQLEEEERQRRREEREREEQRRREEEEVREGHLGRSKEFAQNVLLYIVHGFRQKTDGTKFGKQGYHRKQHLKRSRLVQISVS